MPNAPVKRNASVSRAILGAALGMALLCPITAAGRDRTLLEEWQLVAIAGKSVGYVHSITRQRGGSDPAIVTTEFAHTRFNRMGLTMNVRTTTEYIETLDGALRAASSKMSAAGLSSRCRARVVGDKVTIETIIAGKAATTEIPRSPDLIGPYAAFIRTRDTALKEGGHIEYSIFLPDLKKVSVCKLTVTGRKILELDGKKHLLWHGTVEQDILPGMLLEVWMDNDGNLVRSFSNLMGGLQTDRTTEARALRSVAPSQTVELMDGFFVHCNKKIAKPYQTAEILYRIEAPGETLSRLKLADRRQSIEETSPTHVVLRVRALSDAKAPAADRPGKEFLRPAPYIQSDDPEIVAMAKSAVQGAQTPLEKARSLRQWVYKHIRKKDFGLAFASAKEVALTRRGDCTEHAVLLAALLRAQGIPARVAVGLVYFQGKFGYHMWSEAFLNDWTAFDAALNQDLVDATHIKLTDSALQSDSAATPFLNVVSVIGNLKLTILEVK